MKQVGKSMMLAIASTMLLGGAATVFAQPSLGQQIVNDAASALGGREQIQAVKTIVIKGEGTAWNLGQDMNIDATGQTFSISGYRWAIDLAADRYRVEQTRTPNFTYFAGQAPVTSLSGLDGAVAYNVLGGGRARRASDVVAYERRTEMLYHPLTIIRAALDPAATLSNGRSSGGEQLVDVRTADGLNVTLAIDASTKLPTRVIALADNANLGDVAIETSFTDYQSINGLRLPMRLTSKTDRWKTAEIRVARYTLNAVVPELIAPAAASSAPAPAATSPTVVEVTKLGKGVWMLGPNYNGVVVEFSDHLTIIDGLQNDARALAVIAKARELGRGKPLTEVINTHYHFDHSQGLRAAVSEGLTIITAKENASFYRDVIARKHTIAPDTLSKSPKPLKLRLVKDSLVLKDTSMTLDVYRLPEPLHADGMLMAYIPSERLLVEADAYNGNIPVQPFSPSLVETVKRLNLAVDRVAPIHGVVTPYRDVVRAARAASSGPIAAK